MVKLSWPWQLELGDLLQGHLAIDPRHLTDVVVGSALFHLLV